MGLELEQGSERGTEAERLLELEIGLRERLTINPLELHQEFCECPAQIAYLAACHARAIGDNLRAKIRVKKLWGLALMAARDQLEGENDLTQAREDEAAQVNGRKAKDMRTRITESMVEAAAQQLAMWSAAQEDEVQTEVAREVARGNMLGALAKKDMLVQLGANQRAELERDPVVRDRLKVQRGGP